MRGEILFLGIWISAAAAAGSSPPGRLPVHVRGKKNVDVIMLHEYSSRGADAAELDAAFFRPIIGYLSRRSASSGSVRVAVSSYNGSSVSLGLLTPLDGSTAGNGMTRFPVDRSTDGLSYALQLIRKHQRNIYEDRGTVLVVLARKFPSTTSSLQKERENFALLKKANVSVVTVALSEHVSAEFQQMSSDTKTASFRRNAETPLRSIATIILHNIFDLRDISSYLYDGADLIFAVDDVLAVDVLFRFVAPLFRRLQRSLLPLRVAFNRFSATRVTIQHCEVREVTAIKPLQSDLLLPVEDNSDGVPEVLRYSGAISVNSDSRSRLLVLLTSGLQPNNEIRKRRRNEAASLERHNFSIATIIVGDQSAAATAAVTELASTTLYSFHVDDAQSLGHLVSGFEHLFVDPKINAKSAENDLRYVDAVIVSLNVSSDSHATLLRRKLVERLVPVIQERSVRLAVHQVSVGSVVLETRLTRETVNPPSRILLRLRDGIDALARTLRFCESLTFDHQSARQTRVVIVVGSVFPFGKDDDDELRESEVLKNGGVFVVTVQVGDNVNGSMAKMASRSLAFNITSERAVDEFSQRLLRTLGELSETARRYNDTNGIPVFVQQLSHDADVAFAIDDKLLQHKLLRLPVRSVVTSFNKNRDGRRVRFAFNQYNNTTVMVQNLRTRNSSDFVIDGRFAQIPVVKDSLREVVQYTRIITFNERPTDATRVFVLLTASHFGERGKTRRRRQTSCLSSELEEQLGESRVHFLWVKISGTQTSVALDLCRSGHKSDHVVGSPFVVAEKLVSYVTSLFDRSSSQQSPDLHDCSRPTEVVLLVEASASHVSVSDWCHVATFLTATAQNVLNYGRSRVSVILYSNVSHVLLEPTDASGSHRVRERIQSARRRDGEAITSMALQMAWSRVLGHVPTSRNRLILVLGVAPPDELAYTMSDELRRVGVKIVSIRATQENWDTSRSIAYNGHNRHRVDSLQHLSGVLKHNFACWNHSEDEWRQNISLGSSGVLLPPHHITPATTCGCHVYILFGVDVSQRIGQADINRQIKFLRGLAMQLESTRGVRIAVAYYDTYVRLAIEPTETVDRHSVQSAFDPSRYQSRNRNTDLRRAFEDVAHITASWHVCQRVLLLMNFETPTAHPKQESTRLELRRLLDHGVRVTVVSVGTASNWNFVGDNGLDRRLTVKRVAHAESLESHSSHVLSDILRCGVCRLNEFRCNNGACTPEASRCNGRLDCTDGSDEHGCTTGCTSSQFRCTSGQCIHAQNRCDRVQHCTDGSDEHGCAPAVRCSQSDVMFLLDSSGSITHYDWSGWQKQLKFFVGLADHALRRGQVRLGAGVFSSTAHVLFPVGRFSSLHDVRNALLSATYFNGETNVAASLQLASSQFPMLQHVPQRTRHVVLLIDGPPEPLAKYVGTEHAAAELKRSNVNVIVVLVNVKADRWRYRDVIVSEPEDYFEVSSYAELNGIVNAVANRVCR